MKDNNHLESSINDGSFKKTNSFPKGTGGSLFAMIVLILFVIVFSHYIRTGTFINFSFKSLIDYLADMPDVSVYFSTIDLSITADWGVFNFFRSFLNFFVDSFEILVTISGMAIQALVIIFYMVGLFFI